MPYCALSKGYALVALKFLPGDIHAKHMVCVLLFSEVYCTKQDVCTSNCVVLFQVSKEQPTCSDNGDSSCIMSQHAQKQHMSSMFSPMKTIASTFRMLVALLALSTTPFSRRIGKTTNVGSTIIGQNVCLSLMMVSSIIVLLVQRHALGW